jgi:RNA polymerase sigma-70 factor (ECF subfamily)
MEAHVETLSTGMGPPRRHPVPDSFTPLVRAHTRLVRLAAWQAGAPEGDLSDVAQDVFLKLAMAIDRGLDLSTRLDGWLRRTTYTVTRDRLELVRNAREKLSMTGNVDPEDRRPDPEERMQMIDVNRLVAGVLDALPYEQRIVLVMSDMGEMPMSEIAEDLGIPVGTGYSRLRAARKAFEEKWTEKQASGQPAVLPFALWTAGDAISAARATPPAPPGFEDEVVAGVLSKLAAGLAGTAAAAAGGGAAAARIVAEGAARVGVLLTRAQVVVVITGAMIAGAVLHALYVTGWSAGISPVPVASAVAVRERVGAAPTASAPATAVDVGSAAATGEPKRVGTGAPVDEAKRVRTGALPDEVNERALLTSARGAIERGEPQAALALLARVKSPRFVTEREDLRRLARTAQDGDR